MNLPYNCAAGTQRCRQWMSLISQQLRLRHVNSIFIFNLLIEKKSTFYFTLHKSPMDSAFYTSEKYAGKELRWNELQFDGMNSNSESVVIKIWRYNENQSDAAILSWGVHFSGLVYLGSKIIDIQPRYFRINTVIFFMQNGYFTSKDYLRFDLEHLPFYKTANLSVNVKKEPIIYRKIGVRVAKYDVKQSYNLEKLQKLQELQRHIKNKQTDVRHVEEKIKQLTENDQTESEESLKSVGSSNSMNTAVRFAPQLLTMTSLNKMLNEKPTKLERKRMSKIAKDYELIRFRTKTLQEEKNRMINLLERLKQKRNNLLEANVENESKLMALYYSLHKDKQKFKYYKENIVSLSELLASNNRQLCYRQQQMLKDLLCLYPIEKMPNENKYTIHRIYLPNSEILIDSTDPGISVVLGYICHMLLMCSIFLQVPLRYPMVHFGSRSMIFDNVQSTTIEKEVGLPLYVKGKDKAQFGYAVFLLNKNLHDLRWYFNQTISQDMKETLKHLYSFLKGGETISDVRIGGPVFQCVSFKQDVCSVDGQSSDTISAIEASTEMINNNGLMPDKLVTFSSTPSVNDPLLSDIFKEIRRQQQTQSSEYMRDKLERNRNVKINVNPSCSNQHCLQRSSQILALPEAYLNKQISEDFFKKCASREYNIFNQCGCSFFENQNQPINIKTGFEIVYGEEDDPGKLLDSIEQGTDPLLDLIKSGSSSESIDIKINPEMVASTSDRISRSVGANSTEAVGNSTLRLEPDADLVANSNDYSPSTSLPNIPCQLTIRTDRLLSSNQSFNLVKHRPA